MNEATAAPVSTAIRQALAAHTTLTLAYADADGPGACAVSYTPTAGAVPLLVFVTSTGTRHGRALQEQPSVQVAFTAQRDGQEWSELTGVQGRGICRRLEGDDRKTAWAAYSTRKDLVVLKDQPVAVLVSGHSPRRPGPTPGSGGNPYATSLDATDRWPGRRVGEAPRRGQDAVAR
ncbi:pyridoxamine 5'-phosphate oxidase family protein [Actinacidiphila acididurans]|uniref:Pyridoxamine 5'-phosphate oxidase family protein n=1 Tax=Actinacidiphila acididurans TaxID=2784346 RepID=A0ABS2TU66_9ACTN|nr:pyridoxamine 5'-phosphate oxidase family protein [Actinacidiphila acididurans]MBM9506869.1 pyridoxamine 5'-phosphate oxidase family protein [Actinacidiphila acididurans]